MQTTAAFAEWSDTTAHGVIPCPPTFPVWRQLSEWNGLSEVMKCTHPTFVLELPFQLV